MSSDKSYWKDETLWDKKVTIEIPQACLQEDYDEPEYKLVHLISQDVIFCNNGWWFKGEGKLWPEDYVTLHVDCSDIFAWGCSDGENITYSEICELYEMWKKDSIWGPAVWCIKKRKQMPQSLVEDEINKAGIWDLKELLK